MSQAKITLIGLENYLNPEHSVFEQLSLPEGINRDVLVNSILMRCQEFELLYSDPDFMIKAVNVWSLKNYRTFDKWVKALNIKYDPLYNYDRTEEYTDEHTGSYNRTGSDSGSNSNTRTDNLTMTNNLTTTNNLTDTNDVTLTHSEKAYDEAAFVEKDKDVTDQDQTHTGTVTDTRTVTNTGTVSDSGNYNSNNTDIGTDSHTDKHTARLYGNIGVTTSQQMLQSELDLARWNLYDHISDLFAQEFCIMIY